MTIETKFNIDDNVWLMWKDKPQNVRVSFIEYRKTSSLKENEYLTYTCYITEKGIGRHDGASSSPYSFKECQLFPTKQQLLDSL